MFMTSNGGPDWSFSGISVSDTPVRTVGSSVAVRGARRVRQCGRSVNTRVNQVTVASSAQLAACFEYFEHRSKSETRFRSKTVKFVELERLIAKPVPRGSICEGCGFVTRETEFGKHLGQVLSSSTSSVLSLRCVVHGKLWCHHRTTDTTVLSVKYHRQTSSWC